MKYAIYLLILTVIGCKPETKQATNTEEVSTLKSQIEQLKYEQEVKDSMVNESLRFFNEIQENLVAIQVKSESLGSIDQSSELPDQKKKWVLNEIQQINLLRAENVEKVRLLKRQLDESDLNLQQLEMMIQTLQQDMAMKDEQITTLQAELGKMDLEYTRLFDAYQQKDYDLAVKDEDLNRAFYVYGTAQELIDNGVMEKKNGLFRTGRKIKMKGDFNASYFTSLDIRNKKEIVVMSKEVQIRSVHPAQSYEWVKKGNQSILRILNPNEFWRATRYLIITTQ